MASDPILGAILSAFIESAQRDSFNGLVAASLPRFEDNPDRLRAHLASLVDEHKITCVFASVQMNMQPHVVVYLCYLACLSSEHQQYWNSYLISDDGLMCRQYYQSSILGEFWKNRSIRYAVVEEMKLINAMSESIWGAHLFRGLPSGDVPIGITAFLRPTEDNFHRFVMALDKLLSESIDTKFFCGKVSLEREEVRPDGRIEVQRKGSLTMLEEWLRAEIIWGDPNEFPKS